MKANTKIALSIPSEKRPNRYFSFWVKQNLQNELSEYTSAPKIFAVSDIEGNFQPFYTLLMKNRVIDKRLSWIFGDGHLVIVGDCFDRGDKVTECLWLIYMLEEKAAKHGGKVHFILGNHEIMNLNGDWRYVHPKYAKHTSPKNFHTALYDGNNELWRWLLTKNIMEKIGDILFVHGGIAEQLLELNLSIEDINNSVRPYYTQAHKEFADPLNKIVFNTDDSPFWYRGYYQTDIKEEQIDKILDYFKVRTIVSGHTQMNRVTSFFNGKVINIDTDHNQHSEGLFIRKGRYYRIDKEGKSERIK